MVTPRRRRTVLIGAALGASLLVVVEFPLHTLLAQRTEISATAAELATVDAHNSTLSRQIAELTKSSEIAAIAHEDYGLVKPGQRSYVILPSAGTTEGTNPVGESAIPAEDLGASGIVQTTSSTAPGGSVWTRFVQRLEFWRT